MMSKASTTARFLPCMQCYDIFHNVAVVRIKLQTVMLHAWPDLRDVDPAH